MATRPPIAGLRRLLLVLFLVGAVAVVAVYVAGRRRVSPPTPDTSGGTPSGDITLVGQGFEYTQTEKGRKIFRIRGDSVRLRGGHQVLLDGVALTLYDEKGTAYDVVAHQATYDQENHDAKLEGAVRLSGPDGMELATEALNLHGGGRVADSAGEVAFRYAGAYGGRADRLRFHLPKNFVLLAGHVRIESLPGAEEPLSLVAGTVLVERDRHQVRADQDVELRRGSDVVRAQRLNALLSDDDRLLKFVRARWQVSGVVRSGVDDGKAPRGETTFHCEILSAIMADDGRTARSVEMEGTGGAPVVLASRTAAGAVDTLTAAYAVSSFTAGELREVQAVEGKRGQRVRLVETAESVKPSKPAAPAATPAPLREVVSKQLTATFAVGGDLAAVVADGDVSYRAADVRATGDRLRYDAAAGKGEMTAAAGGSVRATSDRGELVAPRAEWEDGPGIVTATGGVRSTLADAGGLEGSPLGAGEGPVRVESSDALWRRTPQAFLFRGAVRAWQGKNLLLADALRGDRPEDGGGTHREEGDVEVLTATGHVKTVWVTEPAAKPGTGGKAAGGKAAGAGTGGSHGEEGDGRPAAAEPVEVNADEMRYQKGAGTLTYRGAVRVEQGAKDLACRELTVDLDEGGRARTMTCSEAVRLTDRTTGDIATGDRALYDLAARTVDITGKPVKLTKGDGGRIEGTRLVYDLDRGRAQVMSQPPPSEAPPAAPSSSVPPPGASPP